MVSKLSIGGRYNTNIIEFVGLSTDEKPLTEYRSSAVSNGSYFYEMDTKKLWQFDEEHQRWLPQFDE